MNKLGMSNVLYFLNIMYIYYNACIVYIGFQLQMVDIVFVSFPLCVKLSIKI